LHLHQSTLLILFIAEADETITARLASLLIGHDLGRLARRESSLEEGHEDEFIDLMAEITDKDRELWAAVVAAIDESTAGCPV
jgi:hypothetical protein